MKKNKMMRLASAMMVLTLMSTSVISGTFAKYTTQDSGSDVARVAKWGVELQVVGDLYGMNYKTTENTKTEASTGISVQSNADGKNVVAPGTKNDGTGFSFSLKGKPEVTSKVKAIIETQNIYLKAGTYGVMVKVPANVVTAENFSTDIFYTFDTDTDTYTKATSYSNSAEYYTLEDYVQFSDDYYPVVYKLTGSTNASSDCVNDSLSVVAQAIADSIKTGVSATDEENNISKYVIESEEYIPNTDLADVVKLGNEIITWEWAFDNDSCGKEGDAASNFCKADTILGNLMSVDASLLGNYAVVKTENSGNTYIKPVKYTDYCLETKFSIDITVTQVD